MTKRTIWTIIAVLIVAIGFVIFIPRSGDGDGNTKSVSVDTSDWQVFQSDSFDFQVKYPSGWSEVSAPQDEIAPKFNFYDPENGDPQDPLTHHSTGFTHVSVYPEGIPTEGLFGETKQLSGDWGSNVDKEASEIYTLENGAPFAGYIKFKNTPDSWKEAGFAWVRLKVDDYETKCFENGDRKENNCDPLGNPDIKIVHSGEISKPAWPELKAAVKSISFE